MTEKMWKAIHGLRWDKQKAGYQLSMRELKELAGAGSISEAAINAFDYGFIKGVRYQKAQERKKVSMV